MIVKIQHYTFEENEFDIFSNPSTEEILALFNNFDILGENGKRIEDDVVPCFIIEKNNFLISIIPASDSLIDLLVFSPN